jgi:phenylacetyl-CoA:acceptor oxidoreductase subunit 1
MAHWVMVIDLRQCIGCKTCVSACSQANDVAEGFWRRFQQIGEPDPADGQRLFITTACMQCGNPACLPVCPTTATYQRPDGIVAVDPDKCVGCGACIMACPYDARSIYTHAHLFETGGETETPAAQNPRREGTCTKCNFCLPRVQTGLEKNLNPGSDPDATPFCVVTCSTGALNFGDLDDPQSTVSKLIKETPTQRLSDHLGTEPSVYYILPQ